MSMKIVLFLRAVLLFSFNPLNLELSDQHLISPYSNTVESFIMIMRIK